MIFDLTTVTWKEAGESLVKPLGGSVHIWKIHPGRHLSKHLNDDERRRAERIRDEKEQNCYISAQGGLRRILAGYLGASPETIDFERRVYGKPFIHAGLEFNLSHSAGHIVAAVSGADVGVDIESASRETNASGLIEKFFANEEKKRLFGLTGDAMKRMFIRYWVCKEAMVKLSGEGIYHGLRDAVAVEGDAGFSGKYRGRAVELFHFSPAPGMVAAVASWNPFEANCFFEI